MARKWKKVPATGHIQPANAYVSGQFRLEPGWYINNAGDYRRSGWEVVEGLDYRPWRATLAEAKALVTEKGGEG